MLQARATQKRKQQAISRSKAQNTRKSPTKPKQVPTIVQKPKQTPPKQEKPSVKLNKTKNVSGAQGKVDQKPIVPVEKKTQGQDNRVVPDDKKPAGRGKPQEKGKPQKGKPDENGKSNANKSNSTDRLGGKKVVDLAEIKPSQSGATDKNENVEKGKPQVKEQGNANKLNTASTDRLVEKKSVDLAEIKPSQTVNSDEKQKPTEVKGNLQPREKVSENGNKGKNENIVEELKPNKRPVDTKHKQAINTDVDVENIERTERTDKVPSVVEKQDSTNTDLTNEGDVDVNAVDEEISSDDVIINEDDTTDSDSNDVAAGADDDVTNETENTNTPTETEVLENPDAVNANDDDDNDDDVTTQDTANDDDDNDDDATTLDTANDDDDVEDDATTLDTANDDDDNEDDETTLDTANEIKDILEETDIEDEEDADFEDEGLLETLENESDALLNKDDIGGEGFFEDERDLVEIIDKVSEEMAELAEEIKNEENSAIDEIVTEDETETDALTNEQDGFIKPFDKDDSSDNEQAKDKDDNKRTAFDTLINSKPQEIKTFGKLVKPGLAKESANGNNKNVHTVIKPKETTDVDEETLSDKQIKPSGRNLVHDVNSLQSNGSKYQYRNKLPYLHRYNMTKTNFTDIRGNTSMYIGRNGTRYPYHLRNGTLVKQNGSDNFRRYEHNFTSDTYPSFRRNVTLHELLNQNKSVSHRQFPYNYTTEFLSKSNISRYHHNYTGNITMTEMERNRLKAKLEELKSQFNFTGPHPGQNVTNLEDRSNRSHRPITDKSSLPKYFPKRPYTYYKNITNNTKDKENETYTPLRRVPDKRPLEPIEPFREFITDVRTNTKDVKRTNPAEDDKKPEDTSSDRKRDDKSEPVLERVNQVIEQKNPTSLKLTDERKNIKDEHTTDRETNPQDRKPSSENKKLDKHAPIPKRPVDKAVVDKPVVDKAKPTDLKKDTTIVKTNEGVSKTIKKVNPVPKRVIPSSILKKPVDEGVKDSKYVRPLPYVVKNNTNEVKSKKAIKKTINKSNPVPKRVIPSSILKRPVDADVKDSKYVRPLPYVVKNNTNEVKSKTAVKKTIIKSNPVPKRVIPSSILKKPVDTAVKDSKYVRPLAYVVKKNTEDVKRTDKVDVTDIKTKPLTRRISPVIAPNKKVDQAIVDNPVVKQKPVYTKKPVVKTKPEIKTAIKPVQKKSLVKKDRIVSTPIVKPKKTVAKRPAVKTNVVATGILGTRLTKVQPPKTVNTNTNIKNKTGLKTTRVIPSIYRRPAVKTNAPTKAKVGVSSNRNTLTKRRTAFGQRL